MHYNHFTINYIESIKKNLLIEINTDFDAVFFPDRITNDHISNLKSELANLWSDSETAINVVREKEDSIIQSGLFGLVNDLDKALKIGYLISDRVVLIDYLFDRLLRKDTDKIDRIHLGVVATSLVRLLPLAKCGRIVIIPNPFNWNKHSREVIEEVSEKVILTPDFMSLLNMLSITKECQLHPFTIAESEELYRSIINSQIDHVDVIGRDGGQYAYQGLLGALLSEKLLDECEMNVILDVPIWRYFAIISANSDFYLKYLAQITQGGSLGGNKNIADLKSSLEEEIAKRNQLDLRGKAKFATVAAGVGGGTIGVAATVTTVSAPIILLGAILGLSSTLTGLINAKSGSNSTVINVFRQLYNS